MILKKEPTRIRGERFHERLQDVIMVAVWSLRRTNSNAIEKGTLESAGRHISFAIVLILIKESMFWAVSRIETG